MALNTRRMSGMAAQPGGHALLETLDAFRRKHASQNKEIIHRNSDLMRANTDLSNKLRESQNELVALRGDYAALLAASSQLEAKNASLREQLHAAHDEIRRRDGHSNGSAAADIRMQDERFQALRITLDKVVAQLQGAQAICLLTASDNQNAPKFYSPASPPESPPFASLPASFASTRQASNGSNGSSTSAHKLERRISTQAIVSSQPDLSYISEGSQEPSLSLSQQEYKPYSSSDDEDGEEQQFAFNIPAAGHYAPQDQYATCTNQQHHAPFLQDLRQDLLAASYASSVEPDCIGQEIEQNLLSASPKRLPPSQPFSLSSSPPREDTLGRSTSTSPSPTPTMPSFPVMPSSFLHPEPGMRVTSFQPQQQEHESGSSSINIPVESKAKKGRPSLLAQIGVSPGHLDISFGKPQNLDMDTGSTRRRSGRSRSVSPSPAAVDHPSSEDDSDSPQVVSSSTSQRKTSSADDPDGLYLSKTVRHSTSATTLREKAKAAAAATAAIGDLPPVDASPANRVIARRRSNPTLSSKLDLSAGSSSKTPLASASLGAGKSDRKRSSTSSFEGAKVRTGPKIVQAMQPRPSSVPLMSLDGRLASSSGNTAAPLSKTSSVTISRPRSGSAVHRKLPSVSPTNTKSIVTIEIENSPVTTTASKSVDSPAPASNVTGRAGSRLTRSRSSSPEVEINMSSNNTSVLSDMTGSTLPQTTAGKGSLSPSKGKDKGKMRELSPGISSKPARPERRDRESSPLMNFPSQESASSQNDLSNDSMSAANISAREGRRARANVSYQEPSLNKKMRQPAGYVPSIKTTSGKQSGQNLGVRRKSSLQLGEHSGSFRKSTSPAPSSLDDEGMRENQYEDLAVNDAESGGETEA